MLAVLIAALALIQGVDGLGPGESAQAGPPEAALGFRECARGRVLDGYTSKPVVGAQVEVWGEGWKFPDAPIASGVTRVDGSFQIRQPADGGLLRIRASGYRSTTCSMYGAFEILLSPATQSLNLRVVDLEGKPIAGALLESRDFGLHESRAYEGRSNADGRFDLSTFPPFQDRPGAVLSARGYAAMHFDRGWDPWNPNSIQRLLLPGGLEVRLPRRKPIAFRVVGTDGKPLAHRRVSLCYEPGGLGRDPGGREFERDSQVTDESGRAQFASPLDDRRWLIQIEDKGSAQDLFAGLMPIGFEPLLVYPSANLEQESRLPNRFPIHVVDADGAPVETYVGAFHDRGSSAEIRFLASSWKHMTIFAGGPFSGWSEAVKRLETSSETTLQLTREPEISVRLSHASFNRRLHVQVGDESYSVQPEVPDAPLHVPAGGPLVLCIIDGPETRHLRLDRVEDGASLDLLRDGSVSIQPHYYSGEPCDYRLVANEDVWLGGSIITPWNVLEPVRGLAFLFELDPTAPIEGRLGAEGRVPRDFGPTIAALGSGNDLRLELAQRGSVKINGAVRAVVAGGRAGEPLPGGGCEVDFLAPGPLLVDIVRTDGSVISLSLVLADGERRELTLR